MIDLLYLAYNRREFTEASLASLKQNTEWEHVRHVHIYDDGSTDGTLELVEQFECPSRIWVHRTALRSPVAIMNDFLCARAPAQVFCKIDNDVMLPAGWLGQCLELMKHNPEVDLLGIEAMHPVSPNGCHRAVVPAEFIGGIGLMRRGAFSSLPHPNGRFGFTEWQEHSPDVKKAWINPSLPVCLLNRVPFEPWKSLSAQYVKNGWQRDWPEPYETNRNDLWGWWAK